MGGGVKSPERHREQAPTVAKSRASFRPASPAFPGSFFLPEYTSADVERRCYRPVLGVFPGVVEVVDLLLDAFPLRFRFEWHRDHGFLYLHGSGHDFDRPRAGFGGRSIPNTSTIG